MRKAIESDSMIHRKFSLATGKVILSMVAHLESLEVPEFDIPALFIHGTADKITE